MNTTQITPTKSLGAGPVKQVVEVHRHGSAHMVGDGFPVRNLIPGDGVDEQLSPFLLLDYAGPAYFPPTDTPAAWASIRIGGSRPSPSSMKEWWRTGTRPATRA